MMRALETCLPAESHLRAESFRSRGGRSGLISRCGRMLANLPKPVPLALLKCPSIHVQLTAKNISAVAAGVRSFATCWIRHSTFDGVISVQSSVDRGSIDCIDLGASLLCAWVLASRSDLLRGR